MEGREIIYYLTLAQSLDSQLKIDAELQSQIDWRIYMNSFANEDK